MGGDQTVLVFSEVNFLGRFFFSVAVTRNKTVASKDSSPGAASFSWCQRLYQAVPAQAPGSSVCGTSFLGKASEVSRCNVFRQNSAEFPSTWLPFQLGQPPPIWFSYERSCKLLLKPKKSFKESIDLVHSSTTIGSLWAAERMMWQKPWEFHWCQHLGAGRGQGHTL